MATCRSSGQLPVHRAPGTASDRRRGGGCQAQMAEASAAGACKSARLLSLSRRRRTWAREEAPSLSARCPQQPPAGAQGSPRPAVLVLGQLLAESSHGLGDFRNTRVSKWESGDDDVSRWGRSGGKFRMEKNIP